MLASGVGYTDVVKLLLEADGINVRATDKRGRTALTCAQTTTAVRNKNQVVALLRRAVKAAKAEEAAADAAERRAAKEAEAKRAAEAKPVSYTHLTLPTKA